MRGSIILTLDCLWEVPLVLVHPPPLVVPAFEIGVVEGLGEFGVRGFGKSLIHGHLADAVGDDVDDVLADPELEEKDAERVEIGVGTVLESLNNLGGTPATSARRLYRAPADSHVLCEAKVCQDHRPAAVPRSNQKILVLKIPVDVPGSVYSLQRVEYFAYG